VTPKDVHTMLKSYLRSRSDLWFRKAVASYVFESQNPFERQSVRKPQRWFLVLLITLLTVIAAFVYFNLWN